VLLLVLGLVWPRLAIGLTSARFAFWFLVYSTLAILAAYILAAVWGVGIDTIKLAGELPDGLTRGTPVQEMLIKIIFVLLGLWRDSVHADFLGSASRPPNRHEPPVLTCPSIKRAEVSQRRRPEQNVPGDQEPPLLHRPHSDGRWFRERLHRLNGQQLLEIVRTLDKQLNNTSLILLFEVCGRKLLFPGDAQIENWSYALEDAPDAARPRALLADVDVYKSRSTWQPQCHLEGRAVGTVSETGTTGCGHCCPRYPENTAAFGAPPKCRVRRC
jgi:hypothetical protein